MRHPYFDVPVPTVIGHRGACGEAPENTLASFGLAVTQGAAILETDVHLTRDGKLVLIHDELLERTTNGRGRITDHSLAELRQLDAGHSFDPAGDGSFPFRSRGLQIPTLEETLEAFPRLRFNVEIKEHIPALIEGTVAAVCKAGREDSVLLAAAEDPIMHDLREHLRRCGAHPAVSASSGDVLAFVRSALDGTPPPPGPMALQVPPGFGGRPLVTREFVEHAHAHGIVVHVWTINEPAEMHQLFDLGVDGVMSDFPARVAAVIAERAAQS
jgi:glycerophosphoryl diester phosphodiesterase